MKPISKTMREDYERFLMGQINIKQLAIIRNKPKSNITRAFNFLYHEKATNIKTL